MPRVCTICTHERALEIDRALLAAKTDADKLKLTHTDKTPPERLSAFVDWILFYEPTAWLEGNTQETVYAFLALFRDLEAALSPSDVLRRPLRKAVREKIRQRDGNRCAYCGELGDDTTGPDGRTWHVDHIIPWSKSWDDSPSNLALACAACNIGKRDRDAQTFRASLAERNTTATGCNI